MRFCEVLGPIIIVTLTWSGSVLGQEVKDASRAAARELGYSGVESYQGGDYATALTKLEKAYQVLKVPSLGLWSARALIKSNRWVEAAERLREVQGLESKGGDAATHEQAKRDAGQELDTLLPRIPRLVIAVVGAPEGELEVSIDGQAISNALLGEPVMVNPGQRALLARVGERRASQDVSIGEAAKRNVELRFGAASSASPADPAAPAGPTAAADIAPASPDSSRPSESSGRARRVAGWASVGVGAAGLAVGVAAALKAMGIKDDFEASPDCGGTACAPRQTAAVGSYNSLRTISSIGFIAGGVLAGTGIVLLVTAPKSHSATARGPALWLGVAPRGGQVGGTFW